MLLFRCHILVRFLKGGDPRNLITGIVSPKLLATKTCAKHRPIKHYKTTTLSKDDKKLKTLASATGDSISTTN
jgi:hypothetical protein